MFSSANVHKLFVDILGQSHKKISKVARYFLNKTTRVLSPINKIDFVSYLMCRLFTSKILKVRMITPQDYAAAMIPAMQTRLPRYKTTVVVMW